MRLTAQGRREGEIWRISSANCVPTASRRPLWPTIRFVPEVASIAAKYVDKVRINPGNYRNDHGEFEALIEQCREAGCGAAHRREPRVAGQTGLRPLGRYARGMVVSAMEFLRICRDRDFDQVVVSMKSSNTR